ncbi:MAG: ketoacyl-ACP synthase III [Alphaproteobacteria bacterium]|nr:ketoacyl-ACP synthase III [Alphaproteobacteria bacterium]
MRRSVVAGVGGYLPPKILTNADLEKMVDTSDAWIRERTGIVERHIAEGELTSDMAVKAARTALDAVGLAAADVDMIIVATTTPDETLPATAVIVQKKLGAHKAFAFDMQAVCGGFVYALAVADNFIKAGQARTALVIGAETMSKIVDWTDRNTCVLFGDGAGAFVLRAETDADRGILDVVLHSDGRYHDLLKATGGVASTQTAGTIRMSGRDVFRHGVEKLSEVVSEILAKNALDVGEIDWFVPHQANARIIEAVAGKVHVGADNVIFTLDRHGNTSAASIPLAVADGVRSGKIKPGDLILLDALGAGFSWGAALIRM